MMTERTPGTDPIAVVGMACRFPGAHGVDEFWRNLLDGRETISFFTPEQLRAARVPEHEIANPDYVAAAPMMPDADRFDAGLFDMTAREAEMCDPQIRAFMEMCHAGLENAGYDPFNTTGSVGVYGTCNHNSYLRESIRNRPELVTGSASMLLYTLNHADFLATLASYKLNLHGPSMTVLTACSSSLVTVHVAAQALRAGECDMAVAGGAVVEVPLGHGHMWTPSSIHTADGHCRPFDDSASGTIFGSGTGVVVLKRLADAVAAGDNIRAVLLASAVNNDGADKVSFSAPSGSGQAAAVAEAMVLAGVHPSEVDYVEAHATGTALGDPIEVSALAEAYRMLDDGPLVPGRTAIGSVKSNIGHMTAVAGVAGLIKTVLMLEHEAIVPSVNVDTLNPRLELDSTPFAVATRVRPWQRSTERARIAGLSSLGIGGTNVHMVLTEAPARQPRTDNGEPTGEPRVVVWSARTEEAERELPGRLRTHFATERSGFADAAATLLHGRTPHRFRAAVVAASAADAVAALDDTSRQIRGQVRDDASTALLFPGQGAHYPRMAAGLYGVVRSFSIAMDECLELFEHNGVELYDQWMADDRTDDTAVVQPLLFSVEYALAAMWAEWGIRPAALLGHSLGELTAATLAGVFDLPDAVTIVAARAAAMTAHPVDGGLLAVRGTPEDASPVLSDEVTVAAINGPQQTVLAGPADALDEAARKLAATGGKTRRLPVSHAFHHPGWSRAADEFAAAFASVTPHPPQIPLYSGMTGQLVKPEQATDARFWSGQLMRPVLFWPAVQALRSTQDTLLLEAGPGRTLTTFARRLPAADGGSGVVPGLIEGEDAYPAVLGAAAKLWANGVEIDWDAAGQHSPAHRVVVPGYPYQRQRYWIDPPKDAPLAVPDQRPEPEPEPAEQADEVGQSPFSAVDWVSQDRPAHGPVSGTALVLLPSDVDCALTAVLALERAGYQTVRIRPADHFGKQDAEYRVRLGEPDDLANVLTDLSERGVVPQVVVHAVGLVPFGTSSASTLPGQLDATFTSLHALARLAVRPPAGQPLPAFFALTGAAVDVSGGDRIDPAKAVIAPVVRTLLAENPGLRGGVIDIGPRVPIADITAELRLAHPGELVALRGHRRWLPVDRPLTIASGDSAVLRERGVYLIAGGFGGLGFALARHLAATGLRPRLALLGRRDPLSGDAGPAAAQRARDRLAELTALGAEVLPIAADITDVDAVRAAVETTTTRFGVVNGIFQLAGIPGDRMIAFREPADAAAVLAPKTLGTVHLAEAFTGRPALDFVVLFSSRAAAEGMVGGADYAAANAFLDACAQTGMFDCGRVVSVGWPVWLGEGMVDHDGPDITALADTVARLSEGESAGAITWDSELGAATHWALDEHRVGRTPLLPGTAYLDLVIGVFAGKLGTAGMATELTDVVFRAPLSGSGTRPVRVVFTPLDHGYRFVFSSRTGEGWTTHVEGRIAATAEQASVVDLTAVRSRLLTDNTDTAQPAADDQPFTMGPRWRNIVEVWRAGDERLVRAELMAAFSGDFDEHRLHPALLDTVTAAVRAPGEGSYIPFIYRRMVVHADLPANIFGHVRRLPSGPDTAVGDIDIVDPSGQVLVHIEGFTMRRNDFSVGWDRPVSPVVSAPARQQHQGMEPTEGLRLLTRLLETRTPPVVLVRPYVDGRPTPIAHVPAVAVPVPQPAVQAPEPPPVVPVPVPVATDTGTRLRDLWTQALGSAPATDDVDFFEAGGDSLAAVELMARIRATFGIELSIGLLLDLRTFAALRQVVVDQAG